MPDEKEPRAGADAEDSREARRNQDKHTLRHLRRSIKHDFDKDAGKREADHLFDLGDKDFSMAVLIDYDGAELVPLNQWAYRWLTSKVGQVNVFTPDSATDGKGEAK